jgi:putative transcriptional regulator
MPPDHNGPLDRLSSRSPLFALVAAAGGLGGGLLVHQLIEGALPRWVGLPLLSAAALVALGSTLLHWRAVDEAAREAHKSAWYWGGMAGTIGFAAVAWAMSAPAVRRRGPGGLVRDGRRPARPRPGPRLPRRLGGVVAVAAVIPMKNRLKVLRAERDWSQGDLAARLGVSRQTVNALETGKYDPSLPLAFRIARLFGLPIEAVFDDEAA